MVKKFIERPVLSTVISIMIVILGLIGLTALPVTQYPDIAPPIVEVKATYTGANAETVMRSVVVPLEEQINGVEGMDYITSTTGNDGSATIQVLFKQDVDPDIATVNVQNRVSRATPLLPVEVTRTGVTTQKLQTSALVYVTFYSKNKNIDDIYLENYLNINTIPAIKRIKGVGDVSVFGNKTYSMRVWLDPNKLAAYGLEPGDVYAAINEQSKEAAAGQIGQNSGSSFEYVIKYKGKFDSKEQYDNIIIKSLGGGQYLRLADIAKVELGALSYITGSERSGYPSVSFGVMQTPGSNAYDIINDIKKYIKENERYFPEGVGYDYTYDTNEFLEASISSVISTLIEAFILVFIVVYVFLQDFRSTLIPSISVIVSIVGTFFVLNVLGYSINLLTLFALILAIGIVVDDAIVVVEAVHAKLEGGKHTNAKSATVEAMGEITGAIISITLVMAAVFVPVTFISGPVGVFYEQFGVTLIFSILISAINALSLSPALCAILLKHHGDDEYEKKSFIKKFFHKFNLVFDVIIKRYEGVLSFLVKRKWVTLFVFACTLGVLYWANSTMRRGFVPTEDRGILFADVQLPPGASMERTYATLKELEAKTSQIPGVESVTIITGTNLLTGVGSNNGLAFVKLKSLDERSKAKEQDIRSLTMKMFGAAATVPTANIVFFQPPSIPGFSMSSGFEFVLLDKAGGTINNLDATAQQFMGALMQRPEIQYAQNSFNTQYPQYEMEINVPKAKESGVSINNLLTTVQGYIGGIYATDFTKYGKQFRVMIQGLPDVRKTEADLSTMYVRTATGEMAPVSEYITLKHSYGPQTVNRYNLYTSVKISGANAAGYSSGDAINAIREVADQNLTADYGIDFTGLSREEINASSQAAIIMLLCIVFVYFILSAQYESYLVPLAVILSLPLGVTGAFLGQNIAGLENNIYFQIALVMLVGLLAKNAVLIVEVALQKRRAGETIVQSAIDAAKSRFRPILMTSFAFIGGMLPLVFASGIGYIGNRSIGTGAAAGLLIGTILGLLFIPILYIVFQYLQEKISPIKTEKE